MVVQRTGSGHSFTDVLDRALALGVKVDSGVAIPPERGFWPPGDAATRTSPALPGPGIFLLPPRRVRRPPQP